MDGKPLADDRAEAIVQDHVRQLSLNFEWVQVFVGDRMWDGSARMIHDGVGLVPNRVLQVRKWLGDMTHATPIK